jgi:hypothetical protein
MVEQAGALGYFGDARRAAVGTELIERVTATGSLVIRNQRCDQSPSYRASSWPPVRRAESALRDGTSRAHGELGQDWRLRQATLDHRHRRSGW